MKKLNVKYVYVYEDILKEFHVETMLTHIKKPMVLICKDDSINLDREFSYKKYFLTVMSETEMFDMAIPSDTYKNYCAYIDFEVSRIQKANQYGYFTIAITDCLCDIAALQYHDIQEFTKTIRCFHRKRYLKACLLFILCLCSVGGSLYINDGFFAFMLALVSIYFCIGSLFYIFNDKQMVFFTFLDMF